MNSLPLTLHNILENGDTSSAISAGEKLFWSHRFKRPPAQPIGAHFNGLNIGPMSLAYLSFSETVSIEPEPNDRDFLLQVTINGNSTSINGNKKIITQHNDIAMIDPSLTTVITFSPGCSHFALRLDRETLEKTLENTIRTTLKEPVKFDFLFEGNQQNRQACIETMRYLCRFYGTPNPLFENNNQLHTAQAEMIALTLINSLNHNYSEHVHNEKYLASPRHVRQACELIESKIHESISITHLCNETDVSARTLQNGFKKYLGLSPSEYIRERRLEHIHKTLQNADKNTNVSRIMWEYGISNPGLWANFYYKKYGCYPSETFKKTIL